MTDESKFEKLPGSSPELGLPVTGESGSTPNADPLAKERETIGLMLDSFIIKLQEAGATSEDIQKAKSEILENVARLLLAKAGSVDRQLQERDRYIQLPTYRVLEDGSAIFEEENGDQYCVETDGTVWLRNRAGSDLYYMGPDDQMGMHA